ncbi:MAG: hypothetical protein KDI64_01260, partial [Candidatus Accumulibacter sp.]|nr:hypothetical protein [Accumulibacter sp.]
LGGTLKDVTLQGDAAQSEPTLLDLSGGYGVNVGVSGDLTLANATILLQNYGQLYFSSAAATLAGSGTVLFGDNNSYNSLREVASGGELTIASGITVRGAGGTVGYNAGWGGPANVSVRNLGRIGPDRAGSIALSGAALVNAGTLQASGGGTLNVQPTALANFVTGTLTGGAWEVYAGSTLRLLLTSPIVSNAASLLLDGANANFYRDAGTTSALSALSSNVSGGSLTLRNGAGLALASDFSNSGMVIIGTNSLLQVGSGDQYAETVLGFSSQYSSSSWSAAQALGTSDTVSYGDRPTSWAPSSFNGTLEFLTLGFVTPVFASGATIRETSGNGFVYQIDAVDTSDVTHTVWSGTDTSQPGTPVDFSVSWAPTPYLVKGLKIYVDTSHDLNAWEEIDSVRLRARLASDSYVQQAGSTLLDGGRLSAPGIVKLLGGSLSGSGSIDADLANSAVIDPGSPLGTLTVAGDYSQTASGVLDVELGGVSAGSQFDQLAIAGGATLDGTLDVALRNGFTPSSGDSFAIASFASRSGQFARISSPSAVLRANYTGSDLTLLSEVPGIKVNPTFGLTTSEAGGAASFSVTLDTAPTAEVSIALSSDNPAEGTLSTSALVFTPQNWNLPQTVTVTGVDDQVDDGDVVYHVLTAPAVSADPAYAGFNASDVTLTNLNDDHAGFVFSATSGLATAESGSSATFTVALAARPTANVSFALASGNGNEGTVLPAHLTFTPQNWNVAQTVTASGVDDQVVDGDVAWAIVTAPAVSSDLKYQGLNPPDVSLVNHDNDTLDLRIANLSLAPAAGLQSGGTVVVSWTVANVGSVATNRSFSDLLVVRNATSGQTLLSTPVLYDQNASANGPIQAGGSRQRQYSLRLPDGLAGVGDLSFSVTLNAYGEISESSPAASNNTASTTQTATLAPYPDLQVRNLRVQPATGLLSGSPLVVLWDDVNTGNGATSGPWVDRVTVKNRSTGEVLLSTAVAHDPALAANGPIAAGGTHSKQYTFTLPDGLRGVGDLEVTLLADANGNLFELNPAGNGEANNAAVVTTTSTLATYPDLEVVNLRIDPPGGLVSGASFTVRWEDGNSGTRATSAGWTDLLIVRNTSTGETLASVSLPYEPAATGNGSITPGGTRARQYSYQLPDGQRGVGQIQVTVSVDGSQTVFENNAGGTAEANNTAVLTRSSALAAYPDLQVSGLSIDGPDGVVSGGAVTVRWDDDNTGSGATAGAWTDLLVVRNTTSGEILVNRALTYDPTVAGNGNIAAADKRARQYSFQLPDGAAGVGQLLLTVTADTGNALFENNAAGSAESNNVASLGTASVAGAYPDLLVSDLVFDPASVLQSGDVVTLRWNDSNSGGRATSGSWNDYVTVTNLTTGETLATGAVAYQESDAGNGAIAGGASRSRVFAFTLPSGLRGSGQLQATVSSDRFNQIFEYNTAGAGGASTAEANNSASVTANAQLAPAPDLQVTGLAVTPAVGLQSGDSVVLHWDLANTGTGAVGKAFYTHVDVFNRQTQQQLDGFDLLYDPTPAGNGAIGRGDARSQQLAYTLPRGDAGAGDLLFTVTADYYTQLSEYNTAGAGSTSTAETNNAASVTVNSALAPYADLAVSGVTAPALTIGDPAPVTISWSVANVGSAATTVADWVDTIIISPDADPSHGTVLKAFAHQGALATGAGYARSETFLLPAQFQTHSHLFVRTDAGDAVFENSLEADNFGEAANLFDVAPIPYADLAVSAVAAPASGASGQAIQVSWTVSNQSPHAIGTTNSGFWADSVYLASDPAGKNVVAGLGSFDHLGALAVGGSYTHTVSASLPDGLSGTFYVVVRTTGPYEFIYTDNNSAVSGPLAVAFSAPPDLVPTRLAATTPGSTAALTTASAGDKIDVSWNVQDVGAGDTKGQWVDSIALREVGGTRSFTLGVFNYAASLQAGKFYTRTEQLQLPGNVQGLFQLVLTTNAGLFPIFENGATGNNTLVDAQTLTLTVPPNPDLQVFSIDNAPATANAGGSVALDYTVINQGTVEARGHWTDNVYLSLKDHLDGSAIFLGSFDNQSALMPGDKYQGHTDNLPVPKRLGGPAYLIVYSNAGGTVDEFPRADNNTLVQSIYINPEPPADLVTSLVTAPNQTFDGTTIDVSYHVSNLGLETTDRGNWTDTIWLTRDPTRPNVTKGDVLLATLPHAGVLGNDPSIIAPPVGYDVSTQVTLPKHISGQYYITAWSDSFDVVLKSTQDVNINPDDPGQLNNDNYKARPITVLLTPPPDPVVTTVAPQASAVGGDDFSVQWTVQNKGTSATEDSVLFDQVYLSDKPVFVPPLGGQNVGNQWFLGSVEHDGVLAASGSYTAQHTFKLSPEISGRYVIVVTNTGGTVIDPGKDPRFSVAVGTYFAPTWEGPYTDDNVAAAATHVTPLPPADLLVTSVTAQVPNHSGETTSVSWTVENVGAAAWSGTRYWLDDVYFSRYPTLDPSRDVFVGQFAHSNDQPLASGASYTQSASFVLPKGIGGTAADPQTFYVHVVTDAGGTVNTHGRDNDGSRGTFTILGYEDASNNRGTGTLPVIYREPDLQVTDLLVPAASVHSGDLLPVTWTVSNLGNRDTREGNWTDRVFLSTDASLDSGDTQLGEISHSAILRTGEQYSTTLDVRLPDGIGGDFHVLVFTDATVRGTNGLPGVSGGTSMGSVPEFQGEGNNLTAAPLPVILAPPPDLEVTALLALGPDPAQPGHVLSGQSFTVTYTVSNNGSGDTPDRQAAWDDRIYLSRDQFLSDADVYFIDHHHSGGLAAGASYSNTVTLKAPRNMSGPWYVFVISDAPNPNSPRGLVFEGDREGNNATATATPLLIEQPPPSDLVVDSISLPQGAMAGDPIHLGWTVSNVGVNAASGAWSDTAYLSADNIWDIGDRPIGRFSFSGTLQPGGSYDASLDANLPPATPGSYRVIVRSDIFDDILESQELNNRTTSADLLKVSVPELHLGVALSTTLDTGEDRLYQVTVGQGDTLRVDLTSADARAANVLFLRYDALPTGSTYDAAYQQALQANQFAVIPSTTAGTYYVLIHGQSEPSAGTPVSVLAHVLPFGITDIVPDKGGDSRYVTTTILGAQFDA